MVILDSDGALMPSVDFTLDADMVDRHSRRVTISKHPIETGAKPIDHAELEPRTYMVEGIFTNVPLDAATQQARGLAEGTPLDGSWVKSMADALDALLELRQPMTITTDMRVYENMVMLTLDIPRDPSVGDAIQFTATFEEVRFVQTQTVALQVPKTTVPTKPNGVDDQGKKVAQPATPEQETSWAKSFTNATNITQTGSGTPP